LLIRTNQYQLTEAQDLKIGHSRQFPSTLAFLVVSSDRHSHRIRAVILASYLRLAI
jgi:hypothetical protein